MVGVAPRQTVEPSYVAQFAESLRVIRTKVAALERGSTLRNASISGGEGLRVFDDGGALRVQLDPVTGSVIAFDGDGNPAARFGPLVESAPDQFGVEVLVDGDWIRLGYQTTGWAQVGGKPSWAQSASSVPGSAISGAVGSAGTASEATHAGLADGSQYGWTNNVAGNQFFAVWVGNDNGFHFGRNVSSRKYKTNIEDIILSGDPLKLRPVKYDRKPTLRYPETPEGSRLLDGQPLEGPPLQIPGARDEYGLIAEEVAEHVPEIVTYYDGEIDGVRYDLLSVALLQVAQKQDARIAALEEKLAALAKTVENLGGTE